MSEERIDDIDYWWQGGFPGAFAAEVRGKSLDRPQRGAINRGAARGTAAEYRPRDVGGLPRGAHAMTAAAKRRQDLARLLEGPGNCE
jgi:hypothetical protein